MLHYPQLAMQLAIEGGMSMMDVIYNIDTIKAQPQVLNLICLLNYLHMISI